jgi:Skp family chaperone for outer membrane proteins
MSKAWFRVGGVLLVLATIVSVGRSRPEATRQSAAPASRVAVVNLGFVLKNMNECKAFSAKLRAAFKQYEDQARELQERETTASKSLSDPDNSAEKREEIEREVKKIKRQIEEVRDEAKSAMTKESDKNSVILYTAVRKVAESYAKAHGTDLVLHYVDAAAVADIDSPANITRKLQTPGCVPFYCAPGVDISKEVLAEVNARGSSEE